jgi:hypothetical protein
VSSRREVGGVGGPQPPKIGTGFVSEGRQAAAPGHSLSQRRSAAASGRRRSEPKIGTGFVSEGGWRRRPATASARKEARRPAVGLQKIGTGLVSEGRPAVVAGHSPRQGGSSTASRWARRPRPTRGGARRSGRALGVSAGGRGDDGARQPMGMGTWRSRAARTPRRRPARCGRRRRARRPGRRRDRRPWRRRWRGRRRPRRAPRAASLSMGV